MDSPRTGTPRAWATSGSIDANNSGRAMTARIATATTATTSSTSTCSVVMPRKLPNSRAFAPLRNPPYRLTNRNPQASANAWTVPVTADSSL